MTTFKFEVGSYVRLKISANQSQSGSWVAKGVTRHNEVRGQITERCLQECPGGVQRHYLIQWVSFDGALLRDTHRHNEIELVASEPFTANEDSTNDD